MPLVNLGVRKLLASKQAPFRVASKLLTRLPKQLTMIPLLSSIALISVTLGIIFPILQRLGVTGRKKGTHASINFCWREREKWDGFHDLNKAAEQLRDRILNTLLTSEPGTHVWVTHDTILAAFTSRVLEKPLMMKQWPEFLGYLIVELPDDRQLRFSYVQSP